MDPQSSLKRRSIVALAIYLCVVIAIIGTVSYLVVEPIVRKQLEQNLDLRTRLISQQIQEPMGRSLSVLESIVSIGNSAGSEAEQARLLRELFKMAQGVTVSGGLWPKPYSVNPDKAFQSLFFNKVSNGQIDRVLSWDNPASGGYQQEQWYQSAVNQPPGSVSWSRVYIDPFTHVQMITASSPYYRDGRFAGVATVDLSLESLVEFVQHSAETFDLGLVVKDAYQEVITEYNFLHSQSLYISHHRFGQFNWSVDVINARRSVQEQLYELVTRVELVIIPIMLLCVMVGYGLINRYLIKPIVLIAEKVDDSKTGGIIDLEYHRQDEIKHLVDMFNQKTVYLEAERHKAQASTQAKSAFLATLSHEIRTPMNGVLGAALILLKSPLSLEQRKQMKMLYDSGEHMMTLLNEILDFSKIEQGKLELDKTMFPLDSIIGSLNSVYRALCEEKGLRFDIYSDVPGTRWYYSDKARLRQILFNLLNNAVKFTAKGFVQVSFTEYTHQGQLFLSISVKDSGIGIAKSAQAKIFLPFEQAESATTRQYGGTGLGLAIVKQIAELMGGAVTLSSEPGIGTSFRVDVAVDVGHPVSKTARLHRKLDYHGLRLLIAEDNRTNAVIMETILRGKGFACECVGNGELALKKMADQPFDVVLMDNHMPVMDGVEATRQIRSGAGKRSNILILGCTADVFKETRESMMAAGVNDIVTKPIQESELDDALHRHTQLLFQYQPQLAPVDDIEIDEDSLVDLFVAIESQNFKHALTILATIVESPRVLNDSAMSKLVYEIDSYLRQEQSPPSELLQQMNVLVANSCS